MIDEIPAFPADQHGDGYHTGMNLRDWFAGQIINGMFARQIKVDIDGDYLGERIAKNVYEIADAMMRARAFRETDGGKA